MENTGPAGADFREAEADPLADVPGDAAGDLPGDLPDDAPQDPQGLVAAARHLAQTLLGPQAASVDANVVPRSHLDALGAAGLLDLAGRPDPVVRQVNEVLAGADLSTWLVQAQHHGPVRRLEAAGGHEALVAELRRGSRVAGVAFSQLRRWPKRPLTAQRRGAGWSLEGQVPWYTGWGLNDVMVLSGVSADGVVVHGLAEARPGPALQASAPVEVPATRAAVTVSLTVSSLVLPDGAVIAQEPIDRWAQADALHTANASPAVFGLTAASLRAVAASAHGRSDAVAVAAGQAARRMSRSWRALRREAYRLMDDVPAAEQIDRRLALRSRAQRLMVEATTAEVVAGGGGALLPVAPAQRRAREALFLLVQAQSATARRAALQAWGH